MGPSLGSYPSLKVGGAESFLSTQREKDLEVKSMSNPRGKVAKQNTVGRRTVWEFCLHWPRTSAPITGRYLKPTQHSGRWLLMDTGDGQ